MKCPKCNSKNYHLPAKIDFSIEDYLKIRAKHILEYTKKHNLHEGSAMKHWGLLHFEEKVFGKKMFEIDRDMKELWMKEFDKKFNIGYNSDEN